MNAQQQAIQSYFDLGEHTIHVVASYTNGKEQIFVDDQLVSEKRHFWTRSVHQFTLDGQAAEIRFRVKNALLGPIIVEFRLNDQLIDNDEWDLKRIKQHYKQQRLTIPLKNRLLEYFFGGLLGAILGYIIIMLFKV